MQYRNDRYGNPLSVLGFGCMRFAKKGNAIDMEQAEKQIMAAYEAGVNYFESIWSEHSCSGETENSPDHL